MTPPGSDKSVEIRPITGDDWQLWRTIRLEALQDAPTAFGSTYERERGYAEADYRSRLVEDAPAVLAMAGDLPVGMGAGYQDIEGWLHVVAMWVSPQWRGQRIGVRVLDHLVGWAREHGLRVHLDVTVGNEGARQFYQRYGFVETGEIEPLRPGSTYRIERMILP